ncbi:MAG: hypothetical protein SVR81_10895, partial [Chloroflexota bacterium]|nr:hypothetical protein [Chloroflexota bacterium]
SPRSLNPAIPLPLEPVILKTLAPNAADRYADSQAFIDALHQAMQEAGPEAARRLFPEGPVLAGAGGDAPPSSHTPTDFSAASLPEVHFAAAIKLAETEDDHAAKKDIFTRLLHRMFREQARIYVSTDFSPDSFSGSWVFLVELLSRDEPLPVHQAVVVKIASVSLIEREMAAYRDLKIGARWRFVAAVEHKEAIKDPEPVFDTYTRNTTYSGKRIRSP